LQAITNLNELPGRLKKALSSLKKATRSNSLDSVIQKCLSKRINRDVVRISGRVTTATQQKTNSAQDIGLAKLGNEVEMKVEEVLAKLEKHEAECNLRYQRIDEKLDEHKTSLKNLDMKLWGLAILILIAPFVQKFLG
jgi:hypothetical protein